MLRVADDDLKPIKNILQRPLTLRQFQILFRLHSDVQRQKSLIQMNLGFLRETERTLNIFLSVCRYVYIHKSY